MYKLNIKGVFRGHFKTPEEAMKAVEKWARPFKSPWEIIQPNGKTFAKG
jgi:hypothetical protein